MHLLKIFVYFSNTLEVEKRKKEPFTTYVKKSFLILNS